jgi:hypothetical protein
MIALLSPLFGLIVSIVPEIVKIWGRKQDLAHEVELIKLQMDAAKQNVELNVLEAEALASAREGDSLRTHDSELDGGPFINALRASIRPVVTYLFFIFFLTVKGSIAYVLLKSGTPTTEIIQNLWDQDTWALFGSIMGFHFGSRTIEKFRATSPIRTTATLTGKS